MPIHDWTRVDAGLFHDFHQDWTVELTRSLNAGRLPPRYVALIDHREEGQILTNPPHARFVVPAEENIYARRANRIHIERRRDVVAVIEIVSPGNKSYQHALRDLVRNAVNWIWQGVHLLVLDLFPPSRHDPQGIHKAIWDEISQQPLGLPLDKPLTAVAYQSTSTKAAYLEPLAIGDELPEMPVFLAEDHYVPAPLEETYQASWAAFPADFKELLEPPADV